MIGHAVARTHLERNLPRATLLYGPASIGKWTLANHLADHHRIHTVDRWLVDHGLSISTVRLITAFSARAPHGPAKLIIARLDDASRAAQNAMLKTLEEPPPYIRFLFTTCERPLSTVQSRCTTFELGELTPAELERIYRDQGYTPVRARRAAVFARGSVKRGYAADSADSHRALVVNLIGSLATGDADQFAAAFGTWDGRCSELLTTFLTEALTRRWQTFTEAEAHGLHNDRARLWKMVAALTRVQGVRPRLGVRAALEPYLIAR